MNLGEQPNDLQPFDAKQFAQALFEDWGWFAQSSSVTVTVTV